MGICGSNATVTDSLARTGHVEAALDRPSSTARRLAEASITPNTRRAYSGAIRRLDTWLAGGPLDDQNLAAYLAEFHGAGRAPASAAMAAAAACFRARLAGEPSPAGERTARVLAGYRRTAGERGRGQTRPFGAADLAAVLATCHRPRRRGRGVESDQVALERGRLDAVIRRTGVHECGGSWKLPEAWIYRRASTTGPRRISRRSTVQWGWRRHERTEDRDRRRVLGAARD